METLKGKVAVVTGGASGIGFSLAGRLGAEGMKLVIADIEPAALEQAAAALRERGYEAIGVRTDVGRYEDVEALAAATVEAFGKVHLVVNNAGVSITGPIWEMSLDDWRWVYDVNVWGVIHGIKAFVPLLMAHGEGGHIVNTASEAGFVSIGEHAPYCSSKAAVVSLSKALYSEMTARDTGIGVSVVCPGLVDTKIHQSWRNRPAGDQPWSRRESDDPAHREGSSKFQARGVSPEEIADLTLEAVRSGRFYVFNSETWRDMVTREFEAALKTDAPPLRTWGPDLRRQPTESA